jgi:Asp-tRNA(Asn)/Glu-tRNA(Gln) amidotransferase A subunit family amidase
MDKIGPIARSVEDCALVFGAIAGLDARDSTTVAREFAWPFGGDVRRLTIGYDPKLFDQDRTKDIEKEEDKRAARESQEHDQRTLEALRAAGFELRAIDLESAYPVNGLALILVAEAATAFDELTRTGKDDLLERQVADAWPNVLRQGQLIPAVEYLRASRIRTLIQAELERQLSDVDVWIAPSFVGSTLLRTNLTGHPCVVVPNGFRSADGTPTSITFLGRLHGEGELLAVAHAYQRATEFHLRRPPGPWR